MTVYAWGLLIAVALVLIIWFVFVAPAERRMHERKMALMRRKLERNEERLKALCQGDPGESTGENSADAEQRSDASAERVGDS